MKTMAADKDGVQNGAWDYSRRPRSRDFKLPKKISPELKELMKATREAMKALQNEEEMYAANSRSRS